MKILLIEDNQYKITQLQSFLSNDFPSIDLTIRNSYHSGLKEIKQNSEHYKLILLDISMPTYDIKPGEHGGAPLSLAGKLILNEMTLRDITTKVIVVTMYENYVDGTKLLELDNQFKLHYNSNYVGYVYFSPDDTTDWKENLKEKIKSILL
jgi:DNA-binding NarL/FixJ family response regulator